MAAASYEPGPISCEGAAFDDLRLTDHLPPRAAPAVIERDRLFMAARPGAAAATLLDTFAQTQAFADWVATVFR